MERNDSSLSTEDKSYLEDLEKAKKLSLECYEVEQIKRSQRFTHKTGETSNKLLSNNGRRLSDTNEKVRMLDITPRPRPSSKLTSKAGQENISHSNSTITGSNGLNSETVQSIPPPFAFKRHRSLPYRNHNKQDQTETTLTENSNSDSFDSILDVESDKSANSSSNSNFSNDDLILLASPKLQQKFNHLYSLTTATEDNNISRRICDIPLNTTNNTIMSSFPKYPNSSLVPAQLYSPLGNFGLSPRPSLPWPQQSSVPSRPILPGTTSAVIGGVINSLGPSSKLNGSLHPLPLNAPDNNSSEKIKLSTSPYNRLSKDLETLKNDLIDLGQSSLDSSYTESNSGNILEYFDPLVIKEKLEEQKKKEATLKENSTKASTSKGIIPQQTEDVTDQAKVDEVYNASIASCASTSTIGFTYQAGSVKSNGSETISLYPSLEEVEYETIYGHLPYRDKSSDASSLYDIYHPFEYLAAVSCSTPPHEHAGANRPIGFHFPDQGRPNLLNLKQNVPSLPPRNSLDSNVSTPTGSISSRIPLRERNLIYDKNKRCGKLYENIESIKNMGESDNDIKTFTEMLRELRVSCRYVDSTTNKGYITSAMLETKCSYEGHSLKIIVNHESYPDDHVTFTTEITSPTELVIEQSISAMGIQGSVRDFILRVHGVHEYLESEVLLRNYRYIQECIKMDEDIRLVLVKRESLLIDSWSRTAKDDAKFMKMTIEDILPEVKSKTINFGDISIPLSILDRESEKIKEKVNSYSFSTLNNPSAPKDNAISSAPLMQPVKAICTLLGEVVTIEIVHSLDAFIRAVDEWNNYVKVSSPRESRAFDGMSRRTRIVGDIGNSHSFVEILPRRNSVEESIKDAVLESIEQVSHWVSCLIEMYSNSFPVSFKMKETYVRQKKETPDSGKKIDDIIEPYEVRIGAIHRIKPEWTSTYTFFSLKVEAKYGTRDLGVTHTQVATVTKPEKHWFFNSIVFDDCVRIARLPVCITPREARLIFTLYGHKPRDDNNQPDEPVELGWASMQCFKNKGSTSLLEQGYHLLPFWPEGLVIKKLGPAPNSAFSSDGNSSVLTIELPDYGRDMPFPEIPVSAPTKRDFASLDSNTQGVLVDVINRNTFSTIPPEDFEILWEKRHYLYEFPNSLPKILLATQLWDWASLADVHAILRRWDPMTPTDALQLLAPLFPDVLIREMTIQWISHMPDDELINLMPQLVESLTYETFDLSPLSKFLLKKSLTSLNFSHNLFWLIASQVGLGKWASEVDCDPVISRLPNPEEENVYDPKRRRLELMLNSLMVISGNKWRKALIMEYKLIERVNDIANLVKQASGNTARQNVLWSELQQLNADIFKREAGKTMFPLPTSASTSVCSIHPNYKLSSYFNSNALPLKVTFLNGLEEGGPVPTIFKAGDDLRQDMLTIQTIRLIESWWLKEGLDLRVLTFSCVPTGHKQGLVEMVQNAETLCKIQGELGVTGVFRDNAIAEWLRRMNGSTLDYHRAVDNFTLSCAAYCVLTYVLGICDRHNDNIMVTKKGHLFHIDFGKFLGDAQRFLNIRRDRTEFVLTSAMVFVINDGEKGSHKFHRFVDLCCEAFRIVRKHGNVLINLFGLMVTAGIPGVDLNSVHYIERALLPDCSNVEAASKFTRFIEESSQNWFTPFNFLIHSLAQKRFPIGAQEDPTVLSFVSGVFTMEQEGKIEQLEVVSYQKRYDPEKYYSYKVKLRREGQTEWSFASRTYKEYLELSSKLTLNFPKATLRLKELPSSSGIGRSKTQVMAERRIVYIKFFLDSLFTLAEEISHSSLVYTFFHPMLRDELDLIGARDKEDYKDSSRIYGELKLSIEYQRGALSILVLHAVDLACPNGQPPSPYVKTHLLPDPAKVTKRKTRIIKRSHHPSFMDTLQYRLPLDLIRKRILQVSVMHSDTFQENNFLGGFTINLENYPLDRETTRTFKLGNITKIK